MIYSRLCRSARSGFGTGDTIAGFPLRSPPGHWPGAKGGRFDFRLLLAACFPGPRFDQLANFLHLIVAELFFAEQACDRLLQRALE